MACRHDFSVCRDKRNDEQEFMVLLLGYERRIVVWCLWWDLWTAEVTPWMLCTRSFQGSLLLIAVYNCTHLPAVLYCQSESKAWCCKVDMVCLTLRVFRNCIVNVMRWLSGHVIIIFPTAEPTAVQSPVHDRRLHDSIRQCAAAVRLTASTRQHSASRLHAAIFSSSRHQQRITLQGGWWAVIGPEKLAAIIMSHLWS